MTATTSAQTKSFFGKRFMTDIRENKKTLIINLMLELLGLPLFSVLAIIAIYIDEAETKIDMLDNWAAILLPFSRISVLTILTSILLGIVIAHLNFSYLSKKSKADMNYGLPLSNTQRFFADYLSGLAIYIVPVFIAIILSFVILGIGSAIIDMSVFWEDALVPIVKAGFIAIVGMIMLYTVSVFALVFCGSPFEVSFSHVAINILIPATIGCVWLAIVTSTSYGMVGESIFYSPVFTATSPFGAVVFFFMYFIGAYDASTIEESSYYNSMYIRWMIAAVIMIAVYLLASYLLYKFRKAESVSKPYVYKAFFYAIGASAVFCIISLLIATGINTVAAAIAGVIICGVGWFIMEVITRRGFKRFWTAIVGFAATICVVFLICVICRITDGFGASRYVPAAISVESVSVDLNNSSLLPDEIDSNVEFSDKDVIKAVTAFHKEAVDRHYNFDDYTYNITENIHNDSTNRYDKQSVEITYHTIYGSTVMREYSVMSSMLSDMVEAVLCSDEYAEIASREVALSLINAEAEDRFTYVYTPNNKKNGRLYIMNKLGDEVTSVALRADSVEEFRNAYKNDLMEMSQEELENGSVYCYIGSDYWVLDSFENTIGFLEARDITLSPIGRNDITDGGVQVNGKDYWSTNEIEIISDPFFYTSTDIFRTREDKYYYYNGESQDGVAEVDGITTAFASSYSNYYYGASEDDYIVDKNFVKLINASTPFMFNEKPIAVIYIDNQSMTYYIRDTAENRELLNSISKVPNK